MRHSFFLIVVLAAGCAAKPQPETMPPPAPEPASADPAYTEPPAEAPTELPGTYVEGLGDPVVSVINRLADPLTLQITDSSGATSDVYLEAGAAQDVTLPPGTFTFSAASGGSSLTGEHAVETDNAYTWEFSLE